MGLVIRTERDARSSSKQGIKDIVWLLVGGQLSVSGEGCLSLVIPFRTVFQSFDWKTCGNHKNGCADLALILGLQILPLIFKFSIQFATTRASSAAT